MTLVVTGPGFWHHTPYSARAKALVLAGTKVGVVHTFKTDPKLECNTCGFKGQITIKETSDNFAWGECPLCKKPYMIDLA